MSFVVGRRSLRALVIGLIGAAIATPSPAFLFWAQPKLKGEKVRGDEPGIAIPLPGATPKEVSANLVWSMRAGLNVAALQCQFAPGLMTVDNYNRLLKLHQKELAGVLTTLNGYYKRTVKVKPQVAFESFATRTWNSFSTIHAQLEFCETAASIGRDAQAMPDGKLVELAENRMREFRNSLTVQGDQALAYRATMLDETAPDIGCYDKKGRPKPCKR